MCVSQPLILDTVAEQAVCDWTMLRFVWNWCGISWEELKEAWPLFLVGVVYVCQAASRMVVVCEFYKPVLSKSFDHVPHQ